MTTPRYTDGLTLRVLDGMGTEHVLASAPDAEGRGLRAATPRVAREADGPEVRQADIETIALGATLFGVRDRADLPPPSVEGSHGGGFRAELLHHGAVLLDGVVPRARVKHDPQLAQWVVPIVAAASEDLWQRLEDVYLTDLHGSPELLYMELPAYVPDATGGMLIRSDLIEASDAMGAPWLARAYDLYTVVRAVLAHAGITLVGTLPPWRYPVPGVPGVIAPSVRAETPWLMSRAGFDRRRGFAPADENHVDGSIMLPRWSGRDLLEAVAEDAGWRVVAEYAPYPSTALSVRVLPAPAAPASTEGLVAIDDLLADGGYTRAARTAESGTRGVQMASGADERSDAPRYPATRRGYLPAERVGAPPPTTLGVALSRWRWRRERAAEGSRAEGTGGWVPDVDRLHRSAFAVPHVVVHGLRPVPGQPPGGIEVEAWGYPVLTDDAMLFPMTLVGDPVAIFGRVTHAQSGWVSPASAPAIYWMRSGLDTAAETAEGDAYLAGLPVADPSAAVSLAAEAWVVEGADHRPADDLLTFRLARPMVSADAVSDAPSGEPIVSDLTARFYRTVQILSDTGANAVANRLVVSWSPPAVARAVPVGYEIRRRPIGGDWTSWTPSYATAHVWSGGIEAGETYDIEVRPVRITGPAAQQAGQAARITVQADADSSFAPDDEGGLVVPLPGEWS